jgi:hypothetical protein
MYPWGIIIFQCFLIPFTLLIVELFFLASSTTLFFAIAFHSSFTISFDLDSAAFLASVVSLPSYSSSFHLFSAMSSFSYAIFPFSFVAWLLLLPQLPFVFFALSLPIFLSLCFIPPH